MKNDIQVTVYLSTYNQQEYVAQALDSILMQKTSFPFEIIAADDCSTDDTQKIILDYQKRYPGMIETYFTNPNVGGCKKLTDCIDLGLFRGEYLAYLEGDDYWLGEDRLQTLVDFLDANPEYSRVSHRRQVIDENGADRGYDIPESVLGKPFTINDFLEGRNYSDFGSVFRNYFKESGNKYHPLLLASRNVCDFQDMFITQDFGPVYVLDRCFGVYRSRSVAGATNYNSITTQAARCKENIRLAKAVEGFYNHKYDLTPMIRRNQTRLLTDAAAVQDPAAWKAAQEYTSPEEIRAIVPGMIYLVWRGKRQREYRFILEQLQPDVRKGIYLNAVGFACRRLYEKIRHIPHENLRRGYVVNVKEKNT